MKILIGGQRIADYRARIRVTAGDSGVVTDRARLSDSPHDLPAYGTRHLSLDPEVRRASLSGTTDKPGVAP